MARKLFFLSCELIACFAILTGYIVFIKHLAYSSLTPLPELRLFASERCSGSSEGLRVASTNFESFEIQKSSIQKTSRFCFEIKPDMVFFLSKFVVRYPGKEETIQLDDASRSFAIISYIKSQKNIAVLNYGNTPLLHSFGDMAYLTLGFPGNVKELRVEGKAVMIPFFCTLSFVRNSCLKYKHVPL